MISASEFLKRTERSGEEKRGREGGVLGLRFVLCALRFEILKRPKKKEEKGGEKRV